MPLSLFRCQHHMTRGRLVSDAGTMATNRLRLATVLHRRISGLQSSLSDSCSTRTWPSLPHAASRDCRTHTFLMHCARLTSVLADGLYGAAVPHACPPAAYRHATVGHAMPNVEHHIVAHTGAPAQHITSIASSHTMPLRWPTRHCLQLSWWPLPSLRHPARRRGGTTPDVGKKKDAVPTKGSDGADGPKKGHEKQKSTAHTDESRKRDGPPSSEGGGGGEEDGADDLLLPRTCLFVLGMFLLTALLWRLAQPSGRHTGWASLTAHADEVRSVRLYEHYAQVYLDHAKVFLGLVSDGDTQQHMEQLRERYHDVVVSAAEQHGGTTVRDASGGNSGSAATLHDKPVELPVTMRGRPWAEQALEVIGILAWLAPLLYFPVVGVRTARQYAAAATAGQSGEATRGLLKTAETLFKLETHSATRFRDVAGMKEAKQEITEIVDFLRQPERFTRLGAKIPTGALLLGPPGTGKTLLARAVAGESGVGFIAACGSDFVELYVGMGALRVRKLFEQAKKQRCIVYIDEIDAIGLKRQGSGHGERQEQELTLNELLTQLDGFQTGQRGEVMVLASTNVAQEALDPALIRPGRFDRIIHIDAPVLAEREDIFRVHLSHLRLIAPANAAEDATPQSDAAPSQDGAKDNAVAATSLTSDTADSAHATVEPSAAVASSSASTTADTTTTTTATTAIKEEEASTVTASAAVSSVAQDEKPAEIVTTAAASESNTERQTVVPSAFDIEAILAGKTAEERALIDRYAARMSQLCPGFVGADVANVCNEAAILAAREDASHVELSHLERSIDRVLAGIEHRSRALSAFEKDVVAHHEAGHAVAGWFLRRADPLMKVSIVPRSGAALGYAQYLPNENRNQTAQEMRDAIAVALGGRIAEEIFFHHWSTGAADDLRKVGQMAYDYVAAFQPDGVSAAYPPPGSHATRYVRPFGAKTADALDTAAKRLVDEVYAATKELLLAHKTEMEQLARHLLAHEVLTYKELVGYLGVRGERPSDRKAPLSA